jgi:hypothetical protein
MGLTMADVHTRVAQLIALATDKGSGENEARNAALHAVRLIAEHKLLGEPSTGMGGFSTFLSALPIERIMGNVNTIALGASALEIISLKAEIERLRSETERLRAKTRPSPVTTRRRR